MPPWPWPALGGLCARPPVTTRRRAHRRSRRRQPRTFRPRHVPSCTATMPSRRSEPVYAATPPIYTPLPRGETAADWRGEFRKALHKCNDSHGFRNKPRLHELQEARLQEDYDRWLKWREKFGVNMLLFRSSSSRGIIFNALKVSLLIRVRSSLRSRPRRNSPGKRSPRTRRARSSTRSWPGSARATRPTRSWRQ